MPLHGKGVFHFPRQHCFLGGFSTLVFFSANIAFVGEGLNQLKNAMSMVEKKGNFPAIKSYGSRRRSYQFGSQVCRCCDGESQISQEEGEDHLFRQLLSSYPGWRRRYWNPFGTVALGSNARPHVLGLFHSSGVDLQLVSLCSLFQVRSYCVSNRGDGSNPRQAKECGRPGCAVDTRITKESRR